MGTLLLRMPSSATTHVWESLARKLVNFSTETPMSAQMLMPARTKTTFLETSKLQSAPNQTPSSTRNARFSKERVESPREPTSSTTLTNSNHLLHKLKDFFTAEEDITRHYFIEWAI